MRGFFLLVLLVLASSSCSQKPQPPKETVEPGVDSKYKPGQVWTYKTREGEEASRITILQVDSHHRLGNIVHIHLSDVILKSPSAPDGVTKAIHHSPYIEPAINDSVLELQSENEPLPDFREGYESWKTAFEKNEAGVFTFSVAEGVAAMEKLLNNNEQRNAE